MLHLNSAVGIASVRFSPVRATHSSRSGRVEPKWRVQLPAPELTGELVHRLTRNLTAVPDRPGGLPGGAKRWPFCTKDQIIVPDCRNQRRRAAGTALPNQSAGT
jgi:hypothetical protein